MPVGINDTMLQGFGQKQVAVSTSCVVPIKIDEVEFRQELHVVPNYVQEMPMILGEDVIDQDGLMMVKRGGEVRFQWESVAPVEKETVKEEATQPIEDLELAKLFKIDVVDEANEKLLCGTVCRGLAATVEHPRDVEQHKTANEAESPTVEPAKGKKTRRIRVQLREPDVEAQIKAFPVKRSVRNLAANEQARKLCRQEPVAIRGHNRWPQRSEVRPEIVLRGCRLEREWDSVGGKSIVKASSNQYRRRRLDRLSGDEADGDEGGDNERVREVLR